MGTQHPGDAVFITTVTYLTFGVCSLLATINLLILHFYLLGAARGGGGGEVVYHLSKVLLSILVYSEIV